MASQLFGSLLALWIMGFGFAMILQQHRAYYNWTGRALRGTLRFVYRQVSAFVRWAWRNYWRQIVGFAVGVLTTLYFTGRFQ